MNRFTVRLAFTLLCGIASSPLFAITRTWTGAINGNWSVAANWSPSGTPDPADALIFPASAANRAMTNDLPSGTAVGAMTFRDYYTLGGNLLTLTGDVYGLSVTADLKLGASVEFYGWVYGAIDINGQTLRIFNPRFNGPINGKGTIVLTAGALVFLFGSGDFSGDIQGSAANAILALGPGASLPNATVTITQIMQYTESAVLGNLTILPSESGYVGPGFGVLHTKSLVLSHTAGGHGGGLLLMERPDGGSQIDVMGTVTLNGAPLRTYADGTFVAGQTFTIVKNDGADPVNGTFEDLPEGTIVDGISSRFRISYIGGDGNDVVLAALADTHTAISQSASNTQLGEPVMVTATVTAQSGTPSGSVVFTADGVAIGTAPLKNDVAGLTITTLTAGTHMIVATFLGSGVFGDSVSAGITHVVARCRTKTEIVATPSDSIYGQTVRFTVAVTGQPPASVQPAGSVTIFADGVPLGAAAVMNGRAIFETAALHTGVKSMTATYSGDANFDPSNASAIQQNVGKAQTEVDARSRPIFLGEIPVITVFVNTIPGSSLVPFGLMTISEGDVVLGAQSLTGGAASVSLNPLAPGDHTLVVRYGGEADFEASTATIIQRVVAPAVSIRSARVSECNGGTTSVSLVVSLSAPVSQLVRVSFMTVAGSATEGEDYERASGIIEFAPGELTRAIDLQIIGDTFPETDETLSVLLSNPINATLETPSAVIVIANDDQVPPRHRPSRH